MNIEDKIERLVNENEKLAYHICKRFYNNSYLDEDDLESTARIGLYKAAKTFDESKGAKFATYASRCIENALLTLRNYMTYSKQH